MIFGAPNGIEYTHEYFVLFAIYNLHKLTYPHSYPQKTSLMIQTINLKPQTYSLTRYRTKNSPFHPVLSSVNRPERPVDCPKVRSGMQSKATFDRVTELSSITRPTHDNRLDEARPTLTFRESLSAVPLAIRERLMQCSLPGISMGFPACFRTLLKMVATTCFVRQIFQLIT